MAALICLRPYAFPSCPQALQPTSPRLEGEALGETVTRCTKTIDLEEWLAAHAVQLDLFREAA